MGLCVILPSGDAGYWQGWVYLAIFAFLACFTMLRLPEGLAEERMSPGGKTKKWDYFFMALYVPLGFALPAFCAWDGRQPGRCLPFLPIAFGSIKGLVASLLILLAFVARTSLEDRTLMPVGGTSSKGNVWHGSAEFAALRLGITASIARGVLAFRMAINDI